MNILKSIPDDFSGCVMMSRDNVSLYEGAFGYANIPDKIPNRINTRFATASAGKVFVAVGILRLIEEGRLSLGSTIGDCLCFDLKAIDPLITVKELLSHMSGIPDYFDESGIDDYDELWRDYPNYKIRCSANLIPLFVDKPMMYPRGERFQYNNTGFVVLSLIIESVTGMAFDEYLQEKVFLPCSMIDTGYYELDRLPKRCANSYINDKNTGEWYTNIYSVDAKGTGAGGAFTTVSDISRFWDGLFTDKLLSEKTVRDMLSPHSDSDKEYYGYGIWLSKQSDGCFTPYFEGCDPGVSFISSRTADRMVITVVSNKGQNVWQIRRDIINESYTVPEIRNSKPDIEIRKAEPGDLECIWDMNIADNPGDSRWINWKYEYISYNQNGKAVTFTVLHNGEPIGEGSLLFSPECGAIGGRTELADGKTVANINALRIRKEYEGKGYVSSLIPIMENCASDMGYSRLTIGVEANETRNLAIYLHWGYDRFVTAGMEEEGILVLYYGKELKR